MWSPINGLVKTNHHRKSPFFTHMKWEPLMIKCTNSCCVWLASSFYQCLHENATWIPMICSLLDVACFLDQSFWFSSTKHLKCPLYYHFHVSLPSTTLSLPTKGGKPLHIGRSDLSPKNHYWHPLEMTWLIDPSDGLNLMSNHESFFKYFSFYLFKSLFFNQMIFNCC